MTDIVERLRELADKGNAYTIGELWNGLDEAADEIEQLRARIAELEGDKDRATDLNRMLKRNNGALLSQKTAVEHVAKGYGWDEGSDHDQDALGFIIDRIAKLELKLKGEFAAGKSVFEEKERLQQRVWELEAQRVLEISGFLERLGVIAERLYNHDPRRGNLVAGDIKAVGAELIDIAQPLKAIAAAQPAQEQS